MSRRFAFPLALAACLSLAWLVAAAEAPDGAAVALRAAQAPLRDRDWGKAATALGAVRERFPGSPEALEAQVLEARALLLAGRPREALDRASGFLATHGDAAWAGRMKATMADAYAALQAPADEVRALRERAEFLAGDDHRALVAGLYLRLADEDFEGRDATDHLGRPVKKKDFAAALSSYDAALAVPAGLADDLRALARRARCLEETGKAEEAVAAWDALVRGDPKGPDADPEGWLVGRARARLVAGPRDLARADLLAARKAWPRGAAALETLRLLAAERALLARATAPSPARSLLVDEAVAYLSDAVAQHRDDPQAVEVQAALARFLAEEGRNAQAAAQWRGLVERHPAHADLPAWRFAAANALVAADRHDEAVAEWRAFLAAHPNHPLWPRAQEAIPRARFDRAARLAEQGDLEAATAAWRAFAEEYATHELAPQALLRAGELLLRRKDDEGAVAVWRGVLGRHAAAPQAPDAWLAVAKALEERIGRLDEAVSEYEALARAHGATEAGRAALARLERLRRKHLEVRGERVVGVGEPAVLRVTSRNVEALEVRVFKIDAEDYFRRKHGLGGAESLQIEVVQPDATAAWKVEPYAPLALTQADRPVPTSGPGAYLVVAGDDDLTATTLMLVSDLEVVAKAAAGRQVFAWVRSRATGKPVAGARVLASDGATVFAEGTTGEDGVWAADTDRTASSLLVVKDAQVAATEWTPGPAFAEGWTSKAWLATDRPAYRPGDTVSFHGVWRRADGGGYQVPAGAKVTVKLTAPAGEASQDFVTTDAGTFSGSFVLDPLADLDDYALVVVADGHVLFLHPVRVLAYRKPDFTVAVEPERRSYRTGEGVRATVRLAYSFGGPVAGATVQWRVVRVPRDFAPTAVDDYSWYFQDEEALARALKAAQGAAEGAVVAEGVEHTDDRGEAIVAFDTSERDEDAEYAVLAGATDVTGRFVTSDARVPVVRRDHAAVVRTDRKVYRPGQEVRASFVAVDASQAPVAKAGEAVLLRVRRAPAPAGASGRDAPAQGAPVPLVEEEVEVQALPVATDAKGAAEVRLPAPGPGTWRMRWRSRDARGALVQADAAFEVAGEAEDLAKDARLVAARETYTEGEQAEVLLQSPVVGVTALLTFEGEKVLGHRLVEVGARSSVLDLPVEAAWAPNITLKVAIPAPDRLLEADDEIVVLRYLEVRVAPARPVAAPGEEVPFTVTTTDAAGRPVPAEVGLSVVDDALFAVAPDFTKAIRPHFYDRRRANRVVTASSAGRATAGTTRDTNRDLLADAAARGGDGAALAASALRLAREALDRGDAPTAVAQALAALDADPASWEVRAFLLDLEAHETAGRLLVRAPAVPAEGGDDAAGAPVRYAARLDRDALKRLQGGFAADLPPVPSPAPSMPVACGAGKCGGADDAPSAAPATGGGGGAGGGFVDLLGSDPGAPRLDPREFGADWRGLGGEAPAGAVVDLDDVTNGLSLRKGEEAEDVRGRPENRFDAPAHDARRRKSQTGGLEDRLADAEKKANAGFEGGPGRSAYDAGFWKGGGGGGSGGGVRILTPGRRRGFRGTDIYLAPSNYTPPEVPDLDLLADHAWWSPGADPSAGVFFAPESWLPPLATRRAFADTAAFLPRVATGADGKATVAVRLPDNLGAWRATAHGVSGASLFGEGRATLVVRKDLLLRVEAPRFLVQGDQVSVPAVVHNSTDAETAADLRWTVEGASAPGADGVLAVGARARSFQRRDLAVDAAGRVRIEATATSPVGGDRVEASFPVLARGLPASDGRSGLVSAAGGGTAEAFLEVPEGAVPGATRLVVTLWPDLGAASLDALAAIDATAWDGVEPTAHRVLAASWARRALVAVGSPDLARLSDLDAVLRRLVARLHSLAGENGAFRRFDWGEGDAAMTAFALLAFVEAERAGVSSGRVEGTAAALASMLPRAPDDEQALALWALAEARSARGAEAWGVAFRRRNEQFSATGLAWMLLGALAAERSYEADELARLLLERRRDEPDGTTWWAARPGDCLAGRDGVATALALRALLLHGTADRAVERGMERLLARRPADGFGSTVEAAAFAGAVSAWAERARPARFGGTIRVLLDGEEVRRVAVRAGEGLALADRRLVLDDRVAAWAPGRHALALRLEGEGEVRWAARLEAVRASADLPAEEHGLAVERLYLNPDLPRVEGADLPVKPGHEVLRESARPKVEARSRTAAAVGERLQVRIAVRAPRDLRFVVVEDPLPAGFEPVEGTSKGPFQGEASRDDRKVFLLSDLKEGTAVLTYLVQAVQPGRFTALPARAFALYLPEVRGRSAGHVLAATAARGSGDAETPPTPDERWAAAERLLARLAWAEAAEAFRALRELPLRDEVVVDAEAALLRCALATGDAKGVMRAREELLRRDASRVPSDLPTARAIAAAYADEGAHGVAATLMRDLVARAFGMEADWARTLAARGRDAESLAVLDAAWRAWPVSAGTSAAALDRAMRLKDTPRPAGGARKAGVPMDEESVEALAALAAHAADLPAAAPASFALLEALRRTRDLDAAVAEAEAFPRRFPDSPFVDDALNFLVETRFARFEGAPGPEGAAAVLEAAGRLAAESFPAADGKRSPSEFRARAWHAIARVRHVLGDLAGAVEAYREAAEEIADAREALADLTEARLEAPATVLAPVAGGASWTLRARNLPEVSLRAWRVDLQVLFAVRRTLEGMNLVDLAGVKPAHEWTLPVQDGADHAWHEATAGLPVPADAAGAWLVVAKAGALEVGTVVVKSDLRATIQATGESVRVWVTDGEGRGVRDAFVTVSDGTRIRARGRTDARGVFEAPGAGATPFVVASAGTRFAFARAAP